MWVRKSFFVVLSLWMIVTLGFVFLYLLPGDPARMILGPRASAEAVSAFQHDAGLDRPLGEQYARYLGRLAQLDLGESFALRRSVAALLRERGWTTLKLALVTTVLVVLCGFRTAARATAARKGSAGRHV